LVVNIST